MKVANTLLGLAQLPYLFGLFLIIILHSDLPNGVGGFGSAIFITIVLPLYSFLYCVSLGVAYIGYKVSRRPLPVRLFVMYAILPVAVTVASLLFLLYAILN